MKLDNLPEEQRHVLMYHKSILDYLENFEIKDIEQLKSVWRSKNTILKIETDSGFFVFKHIFDISEILELEQHKRLKKSYRNFTPKLFVADGQAFLMEHVKGDDFFSLIKKYTAAEVAEKMQIAGKTLAGIYSNAREKIESSGIKAIDYTLGHYASKCLKNGRLSEAEMSELAKNLEKWKQQMSSYAGQTAHCDLNCANLIISDSTARVIDPEYDYCDSFDIARDLGRYSASVFLNNFDYNGQNLEESALLLYSFLSSFGKNHDADSALVARTAFYHAQSALSFSNFNTKTVKPKMFADYALSLFSQKAPESFEELVSTLAESFRKSSGYLR